MINQKPNLATAMTNLIEEVRGVFPFYAPESSICGDSCEGCPKKLLELVDTELCYWEDQVKTGTAPTFDELNRVGKLCKNVRRGLKRNGLVD